ncbi:tetratricopeptide repeat protein [Sulfitobacter sp.]|uniref:tetratricopeptide repeat protein n=1 Tax=Sulfitobacter sp. TaxID=1903071 RepID=UPI003EFAADA8
MKRFRLYIGTLLFCSALTLAACKSDEEKAEYHYQSAIGLIEEGDIERALVELRNVFKNDGFHKEARLLYAQKSLELGRTAEAYGQYLRLVEQYPDTLEARVALAEMAIARNSWDDIERHGLAALELSPEETRVQSINLYLKYRQAVLRGDDVERERIATEAAYALELTREAKKSDNAALVRIVIDNYVQGKDPDQALAAVDGALVGAPLDEDLNKLKTRLLAETGDIEGTGVQLKKMIEIFPESTDVKQALIQWYISQGDVDGAEAFLRTQAGDDTMDTAGHVSVIQFLQTTKGLQDARAETVRLQTANEGTQIGRFYAGMIASTDFQIGDREKAINDLRTVVDASDEGQQKVSFQIMLAQMLQATGKREEAIVLVNTILETDAGNVTALQMRATKLIEEDKPGDAIVALRRALDQSPRDPDTLTLMARAHARSGDTDLVGERLALAMDASGHAVPEVLRYAKFLTSQGRQQAAATVLADAWRRAPSNIELSNTLADLHLQTGDWQQAKTVVQELRNMNTPQAQRAATQLEAKILHGQNRTDESLALLQENMADQTNTNAAQKIPAVVMIVQTQIRGGKIEAARATLDKALADTPQSTDLRMLKATVHTLSRELDAAETIYRDLMEEFPQSELPARMLVTLLKAAGRPEDARKVLRDTLDILPENPDLMLMNASFLESDGDIEGAIAIYESLYLIDSSNLLVANNLASLIATYHDNPDSLARAANIIRRLRGTDVPEFQDTYGWISYRRKDFEEALEYLEPAAKALPQNVLVQYHLGMTYAALERNADAKAQLGLALEIGGDAPLPQLDHARQTLAGLN